MRVKLRLYAYLGENRGKSEEVLEVEEGTRVGELWNDYKNSWIPNAKNFRVCFAVNGEYAEEDRELKEGDEVAFIPPVSGG
ncbi:MAG: MoaD/ThiS family protein [Thermodesulfobacteriota bacterium]